MMDIESLRKDLQEECLGGFFVGGYGGALMEAAQIEKSQPEELIKMAKQQGFDISRYQNNKS